MRVVIIGLGQMGRSHALAHHRLGSQITGLVNRSPMTLPPELQPYPHFTSLEEALTTKPDLVVIATYSDSHAALAIQAMQAGAHVFVEKPLATTVADAESVAQTALQTGRKLVTGYILRHHPAWQRLIHEARAMGGPYVFRMNLNQQSSGPEWAIHKALMRSTSPLVDCGVHYVDVMCQVTEAKPIRVQGIGLRLSPEIAPDMYNYGQLQVIFDDGSVGWYEAGWGPMMSQTAYFVKDIITPNGAVSIIDPPKTASADIDGHTATGGILIHRPTGDTLITDAGEPGHQGLCDLQQAHILRAITEDLDLTRHIRDAVQSLRICLAADQSIRSGQPVALT
jgi:predicted dehydrogenase